MANKPNIPAVLIQKVFQNCYGYTRQYLDAKKTTALFLESQTKIAAYFPTIQKFSLINDQLAIPTTQISENDLLVFSVWIQQFIKSLNQFFVGLSVPGIDQLTIDDQDALLQINFYEFYRQAQRLNYE